MASIQKLISYSWYLRLGGLTVYPLLSILLPYPSNMLFVFWTPICAPVHHVVIHQQKEYLKYECSKKLGHSHDFKFASFPLGNDTTVQLHKQCPILTNRKMSDIVIKLYETNIVKTPIDCKLSKSKVTLTIPPIYLRQPFQQQVNDIINFRRSNFRFNMTTIISCISLYWYGILTNFTPIEYIAPITGFMSFILLKPRCNISALFRKLRDELSNKKLSDLITPNEMSDSLNKINISDCFWCLSTTGNLIITNSYHHLLFHHRRFFKIKQ